MGNQGCFYMAAGVTFLSCELADFNMLKQCLSDFSNSECGSGPNECRCCFSAERDSFYCTDVATTKAPFNLLAALFLAHSFTLSGPLYFRGLVDATKLQSIPHPLISQGNGQSADNNNEGALWKTEFSRLSTFPQPAGHSEAKLSDRVNVPQQG